ncbi:DNA-binding protein, partial [Dysosmobacter welbionis]
VSWVCWVPPLSVPPHPVSVASIIIAARARANHFFIVFPPVSFYMLQKLASDSRHTLCFLCRHSVLSKGKKIRRNKLSILRG